MSGLAMEIRLDSPSGLPQMPLRAATVRRRHRSGLVAPPMAMASRASSGWVDVLRSWADNGRPPTSAQHFATGALECADAAQVELQGISGPSLQEKDRAQDEGQLVDAVVRAAAIIERFHHQTDTREFGVCNNRCSRSQQFVRSTEREITTSRDLPILALPVNQRQLFGQIVREKL